MLLLLHSRLLPYSHFPLPSFFPAITPTPRSPLLYADTLICPLPLSFLLSVLSVPFYLPRSSHSRAQSVASLLHPSALVAAECAPLCREGCGGAGYSKREYSEMCSFVRARMSLAIVRSNSLLLRGPRDKGARIRQRPELTDGAVMPLLPPWRG